MPADETTGPAKDITIRNINGKTVLVPVTALTHKNCDQLDTLFNGLFKREIVEMVLDLKKVPLLDSRALELMVDMQNKLQAVGGNLVITNLNEVCRDILICVRLINRFNVIAKV